MERVKASQYKGRGEKNKNAWKEWKSWGIDGVVGQMVQSGGETGVEWSWSVCMES